MPITYGPHGHSFIVRRGGRVVQRTATLAGAQSAAHRVAGQYGGEVVFMPAPEAPEVPAPPARVVPAMSGPALPDDWTEILHLSISALRARLAVGDLDVHLTALEAAESGRTDRAPRAGALEAIRARRA